MAKQPLLLIILLLVTLATYGQQTAVVSGSLVDRSTKQPLPFATVLLKNQTDTTQFTGAVTDQTGRFTLDNIPSGSYVLTASFVGYAARAVPVLVGQLNTTLDLGRVELEPKANQLGEVIVEAQRAAVSDGLDTKTFSITDNISQSGGSVLNAMQNLPGITVNQEGRVILRGSDKVIILIDGKQTALTGFGGQKGLDNLPASAVERIEVINNPSAKYDPNGMAGIINIVYKKGRTAGLHGSVGLTAGVGEIGTKRENYPGIRAKYAMTPKVNPSVSLNYRTPKINFFFQGDVLLQTKVNKNEFFTRSYDAGARVINQQYLENRTQEAFTVKGGLDWYLNDANSLTLSTLYNREHHIDRGDLPYFNAGTNERVRLWVFDEDETNTALNYQLSYKRRFKQPGHTLDAGLLYTRAVEDEGYQFTDLRPGRVGSDGTHLLADERVTDLNFDYVKPLRAGRLEAGSKLRWRNIPVEFRMFPGQNSILDPQSGAYANYRERIYALYSNYIRETRRLEMEAGLRLEQTTMRYDVDPNHRVYRQAGYEYFTLFPNVRLTWKLGEKDRVSLFYNRRVDRPTEFDVRAFPKYDDTEILKVGNPYVRPQFTQTLEAAYRRSWDRGYVYGAIYFRQISGIITRILTNQGPSSPGPFSANPDSVSLGSGGLLLSSIPQNAGNGTNQGIEVSFSQILTPYWTLNGSVNVYRNQISAYEIVNPYPLRTTFLGEQQQNITGNVKANAVFKLPSSIQLQLTGQYLAPDILPQGRIRERYSVDLGAKKALRKGKSELTLTATDLFNTFRIQQDLRGDGFRVVSTDYYETQVVRVGYTGKF